MNILTIRMFPDPILREKCLRISEITLQERELFNNMAYTMKLNNGVGLAASQVGIAKQMIVAKNQNNRLIKMVNPVIVEAKGSDFMLEGCLSVPDEIVEVERPFEVVITGINEKGKEVELKASGLLARIMQHEIDHLCGKLIIDYKKKE